MQVELPAPVLYQTGDPQTAPVWPPAASLAGAPQPPDRQLDELLACPAIASMAGRASVPADHPNHVFGFGPAGDLARSEADVLLVAGSRMGNLDVPYDTYWGDPDGKRLIQIDIDPRHFGVTRPLHLGILADAKPALEGIAARLRCTDLGTRDGADLARYRTLDDQVQAVIAAPILQWQGPGIHPAHALGGIGAVFGPDAVYTVDGGNTALWAYSVLPPTRPHSYHSILELGMLGTRIPSAIGAKFGAADRLNRARDHDGPGLPACAATTPPTSRYRPDDGPLLRGLLRPGQAGRGLSVPRRPRGSRSPRQGPTAAARRR